ncbi:baseplate J/gp47 family protein [Tardiphaga sp. 862_B3_N1_1]|uniref:baseplate J/gp47 family protein n=1 Tax=Tardiphaga sp. 862_B3_N1_1 TaxID=3240763 RepID=UPI003F8C09E5
MSFQTKDFRSIVAGEINVARSITDKVTDFQPGSVVRTLLEAPAAEMEELYLQMLEGLREAIPVATYLSFDFTKLPAARAHGYVTLAFATALAEDWIVLAGTQFWSADDRLYVSTEQVTWPAGALTIRVPVDADRVGAIGNIVAGGIVRTSLTGYEFIVSNQAITTGRDVESDPERKSRFAQFIASLSRGTINACRFAVASVTIPNADGEIEEYVTRVGELEVAGYVRFWIYSSKGRPTTALIEKAQRALDGWRENNGTIVPGYRPAGVRVEALPMDERTVAMAIQVSMYPGFELDAGVKQKITDLYGSSLRSIAAGGSMHLKTLVENMLAVNGVRLIVPNRTENIYCAPSEALGPGILTITAL